MLHMSDPSALGAQQRQDHALSWSARYNQHGATPMPQPASERQWQHIEAVRQHSRPGSPPPEVVEVRPLALAHKVPLRSELLLVGGEHGQGATESDAACLRSRMRQRCGAPHVAAAGRTGGW